MSIEERELPTQEQLDLIERFRVAFNSIETHLRFKLDEPSETPFQRLISLYGERQPAWNQRDGFQLRIYADLRNALVHSRQRKDEYLSVPLPYVVVQIEQIQDRLVRPEKVFPKFQTKVHKLLSVSSLSVALRDIEENNFSQFPVYDENGGFCGLLTENGITRWLAGHVANTMTLVEFKDTTVESVLSREESRPNYKFISRTRDLLDVIGMFSGNIQLEAVLITDGGKTEHELLGIITRSDVQEYLM